MAAKVAVHRDASAGEIATSIDVAEAAIRTAEPIASVIYLEPDIYREVVDGTSTPPGATPV